MTDPAPEKAVEPAPSKPEEEEAAPKENKDKVKWVYGYLYKLGAQVKNWKLRIFLLKPDGKLRYYDCIDPSSKVDVKALDDPLGIVEVKGGKVFEVDRNVYQRVKDSYIFGITPKDSDRTYILEAATQKKRDLWMNIIKAMGATKGEKDEQVIYFPENNIECWMEKMGEKEKATGWKCRYFTASQDTLYYFKDSVAIKKNRPSGEIPLGPETVFQPHKDLEWNRPYAFSLTLNGSKGRGRRYLISAASLEEKEEWADYLTGTCQCALAPG
jgi:hypothetical protein